LRSVFGAANCGHSSESATGRDLPDADGPGFVSLNGGFGEANRSLIGQLLTVGLMKW